MINLKWNSLALVVLMAVFLAACSDDNPISPTSNPTPTNPGTPTPSNGWLIPLDEVRDGGPGKDGIPSIDNPSFESATTASGYGDLELVVGVKVGNVVRAYPHFILDWHEIVNDDLNGTPIALTYCPLTGTAIGWDPVINGQKTEFGVSGLLYNSNLMPYDRNSNSTWSQMRLDCVNGDLIQTQINTIQVVETTWATWRKMYPSSVVMTEETGIDRPYGFYPYGDYRTSSSLIFPVDYDPKGLHPKKRVLGIEAGGSSKVFPIDLFAGDSITVKQDQIGSQTIVVAGSEAMNFMVAYSNKLDDETLVFEAVSDTENGAIMKDQLGNVWNIFGEAIEGPSRTKKLPKVNSYIAYWFAWSAFHQNAEVYN